MNEIKEITPAMVFLDAAKKCLKAEIEEELDYPEDLNAVFGKAGGVLGFISRARIEKPLEQGKADLLSDSADPTHSDYPGIRTTAMMLSRQGRSADELCTAWQEAKDTIESVTPRNAGRFLKTDPIIKEHQESFLASRHFD